MVNRRTENRVYYICNMLYRAFKYGTRRLENGHADQIESNEYDNIAKWQKGGMLAMIAGLINNNGTCILLLIANSYQNDATEFTTFYYQVI